jgi:Fe-S cluster assembly ATPase SufC
MVRENQLWLTPLRAIRSTQLPAASVTLDGEDVLAMSVDERAKAGLFLAMQYPSRSSWRLCLKLLTYSCNCVAW